MFSYEFVSMIIIPVSMIIWLVLDSQQLTLQPSLLYWFALSCGGGNWTEFLLLYAILPNKAYVNCAMAGLGLM